MSEQYNVARSHAIKKKKRVSIFIISKLRETLFTSFSERKHGLFRFQKRACDWLLALVNHLRGRRRVTYDSEFQ